MKSHRRELWFEMPRRRALENIAWAVQSAVDESGITEVKEAYRKFHPSESSRRGVSR
jgi:hypothetical protein